MFAFRRYTYAEQMWKFLRYDRSDKFGFENEIPLPSSAGPVPLYKWPGSKIDRMGETTVMIENVTRSSLYCFLQCCFVQRIKWNVQKRI